MKQTPCKCPSCGMEFRKCDPSKTRCSCGVTFDGDMNIIDVEAKYAKAVMDTPIKGPRSLPKAPEAVGTALESLIPQWALKQRSGCDCKSWVKKMNKWGVEGCEDNFETIVQHLVGQKKYLVPALQLVPDALARVGAEKILRKAINSCK